MSIEAIQLVLDTDFKPTEKIIMIVLANYCGENFDCYPSISTICAKTSLSERAVQTALRRLEATNNVTIEAGGGRKNSNLYILNRQKLGKKTPHMTTETPQEMHPAGYAPPHMTTETPHMTAINPAGDAPEPLRTFKEPLLREDAREEKFDHLQKQKEFQKAKAVVLKNEPLDLNPIANLVGEELAMQFCVMRKQNKKTLTQTAVNLIAKNLIGFSDPKFSVEQSIMNGWAGVFDKKPEVGFRKGNNVVSQEKITVMAMLGEVAGAF